MPRSSKQSRSERTGLRAGSSEAREATAIERERLLDDLCNEKVALEAVLRQMQQRERQLRTILDTLPVGVVLIDTEGDVLRCNPAAERICGRAIGAGREPHGRDAETGDWIAPSQRAAVDAALRGETLLNEIIRVQCPDGDVKTIRNSAVPVVDDNDSVRGAVMVVEDVTEARRAEEALRESEQRFRTLADNIPQLAWMADQRGWIFWYNWRWYEYTGARLHETDGWGWQKVHHPEHVERVVAGFRRSIEMGKEWEDTFPLRGADGNYRWFLSRAIPIRDQRGQVTRWFGTNTDVTEQRAGEESLRRTVERTSLLSEVASQLLAAEQPREAVESLYCKVMVHLGCHVFLNYLVDDEKRRLRLNAWAGIPEEAAQSVEWLDFDSTVCGNVVHGGCRIVAEDIPNSPNPRVDHLRSFGIKTYACHPLLNQGQVIGTLSFGSRAKAAFAENDLSLMSVVSNYTALAMQRVRLREVAERRAAEAQAANEAKSRFLANISHELRTPMNAILGMIDLTLPKQADATARDFLSTARESADLLLALLNDLLDSAKIESGNVQLEAAPFSLRLLLDHVTRVLALRANEKGLAFDCHITEDVPDALVGDKVRLRQVLLNLVGNAIKFTDSGGVSVEVRVQSHDRDEASLEFVVQDTGIGIPQSDLDSIFKPFVQADASTARRFGGTGLGLSISANLVSMMGGRIWVESESGHGSTFHFTVRLPLAKGLPPEGRPAFQLPSAPAAALRILLVEDNPANQKLAAHILRDRGHTVEIAGDGHQAVRMSMDRHYDVILMDLQMPGMDGLETTAAIRAREHDRRRVPIIAMTAHAMAADRERCLTHGMDGYLAKPIDAREMLSLVERSTLGATSHSPGRPATTPPSPRSEAIFNPDVALKRCTGSRNLLTEMAKCFSEETERLFPQLRLAEKQGDLALLSRLAHRLKGTIVYLGAERAEKAAEVIEEILPGESVQAKEALLALEQECELLKSALTLCETPVSRSAAVEGFDSP